MMEPNRQNTEDTGEVAAPGATHVTAHPLIARICPSTPVEMPTVFPTRESPELKLKRSEKTQVALL
jgi:hypothetical protein